MPLIIISNVKKAISNLKKGYFGGGSWRSDIFGIDFTTESALNSTAVLNYNRAMFTTVESTTKGYFCGGSTTTTTIAFIAMCVNFLRFRLE